jgi:hypothetical protein
MAKQVPRKFVRKADGFVVTTLVAYDSLESTVSDVSDVIHSRHDARCSVDVRFERIADDKPDEVKVRQTRIDANSHVRVESADEARTQSRALAVAADLLDDFLTTSSRVWIKRVKAVRDFERAAWKVDAAERKIKTDAIAAAHDELTELVAARLKLLDIKLNEKALAVWVDCVPVFEQALREKRLNFSNPFVGAVREGISSHNLSKRLFGGVLTSLERRGFLKRYNDGRGRRTGHYFLLLENGHRYFELTKQVESERHAAIVAHKKLQEEQHIKWQKENR